MVRWSFVYLFLRSRLVSLSLSTGPYTMVIDLKLCWYSNSQDLISNSPYCQSYSSCDVSLENLVLDQLIIPQMIFFFILITCLLDFVLILSGEILSWSLVGGNYTQSTPKCKWLKKIHRLASFGLFVFFCTPFVFRQIEELKKEAVSFLDCKSCNSSKQLFCLMLSETTPNNARKLLSVLP